jgi:threonine/homoserine/homoserine lactone efflux protein
MLSLAASSRASVVHTTDSLYVLLGSAVGKFLHKSTRIQRLQRYITGGIYITLGLTTAIIGSEKK